jgi:hypothetical protein
MNGPQGHEHAPTQEPESNTAVTGIAAGVPFLAIPPTSAQEPAPMIIAWHAFEPPRSEAALAGAFPLHQVEAWRCYLGLPFFGERLPRGGVAEVNRRGQEDYLTLLFEPAVEQAAHEAAAAVRELCDRFPVLPGHLGAVGVGAGASAALLCAVRGVPPLAALALVNPVVGPPPGAAARARGGGGAGREAPLSCTSWGLVEARPSRSSCSRWPAEPAAPAACPGCSGCEMTSPMPGSQHAPLSFVNYKSCSRSRSNRLKLRCSSLIITQVMCGRGDDCPREAARGSTGLTGILPERSTLSPPPRPVAARSGARSSAG